MIKKIIGVLFIIIGGFFGLNCLKEASKIQELIRDSAQDSSKYQSGYLFGYITVWVITIVLSFFLIKYGIRWVRKKTPNKQ